MPIKSSLGALSTQLTVGGGNLNPINPSAYFGTMSGLVDYDADVIPLNKLLVGTDLYVVGKYNYHPGDFADYQYNTVLQKIDTTTNTVTWQRFLTYGDIATVNPEVWFNDLVYYNNSIFCFGQIEANAVGGNPGGVFVAKYDTNGTLQLQKIITGITSISNVQVDNVGSFYGISNGTNVIKLNNALTSVSFHKSFPTYTQSSTTYNTPTLTSGKLDSNNNYVAAGFVYINSDVRPCIFKISSAGSLTFQYYTSSGGDSEIYSLCIDSSNDMYIAGYNRDHEFPATAYPGMIQKINNMGQIIWTREYSLANPSILQATYLSMDIDKPNGYLYLTGSTGSIGILTKIDTNGALSFTKQFAINWPDTEIPIVKYFNSKLYVTTPDDPVLFTWLTDGTSPKPTVNPIYINQWVGVTSVLFGTQILNQQNNVWNSFALGFTLNNVIGVSFVNGTLTSWGSDPTDVRYPIQLLTNF